MAAEADRDEDLELALRLHRELNAVPRRQRQPVRTQAATAALKTLSKKHHRQEEQEESSESESDAERSGGSDQKRRRGGGGGGGAAGGAPSDNDSGSKRKRQREGQGGPSRKGAGRGRTGRRPQHIAAADEAKNKAARAAVAAGAGDGARTHVKCFYAGLQHGAWLAVDALASRASLAAAVSRVFREDGVTCSSDTTTVVFVTADKQSLEFPAGGPGAGEKAGTAAAGQPQSPRGAEAAAAAAAQQQQQQQHKDKENKWEAAAKRAVRVYVR